MKVICIMQARVGSTRLPEKVLKKIEGKTVLEHDVNRLKLSTMLDDIVIATTLKKEDEKIVCEAKRLGVKYFRGSEKDVLSRYYFAAKEINAEVIVRVTSDCPCLDFNILDEMIKLFKSKNGKIDYLNNTMERSFPRGYDIEIFTFEALENAFNNASKEYEREHVTPYLYDINNNFKVFSYKYKKDYSMYRVTLDTREDFEVIKSIYEELFKEKEYFGIDKVIEFLECNPHIATINNKIEQKKLGE